MLQEYQQQNAPKESVGRGGPEFATQLLVKALGNEDSRPLVDQVRSLETTSKNFEAVQKADAAADRQSPRSRNTPRPSPWCSRT